MAAQRGKDMLLKVRDDTSAFVTVAGLRSRRIAFDAEAVDITHAESAGRWRHRPPLAWRIGADRGRDIAPRDASGAASWP